MRPAGDLMPMDSRTLGNQFNEPITNSPRETKVIANLAEDFTRSVYR